MKPGNDDLQVEKHLYICIQIFDQVQTRADRQNLGCVENVVRAGVRR